MSTSYSIKGTIQVLGEIKQVSDRFRKRDLVLEVSDGKYPQMVSFQCANDRCEVLNGFNVGDEVSLEFNVRGREWKSPSGEVKYFNTLDAWKIERVGEKKSGGGSRAPAPPAGGQADDDIPFATCNLNYEPSPIANILRETV